MYNFFNKVKQYISPEKLYIVYFSMMLLMKGIGLYDGMTLYKFFFLAAMCIAVVKVMLTRYSIPEWVFIMGSGILSLLVYMRSGEKGILVLWATVIGMKGVNVQKLLRIALYIWGTCFVGMFLFHLCNLQNTGFKVHEKLGFRSLLRWDMGYSHPNVFHIAYFVLCMLIVYNLGIRYNLKHAAILMAINLYVFFYSVSFTGIVITTFFLILSLYVVRRGELSEKEYWLCELVFPLSIGLSYLGPVLLPQKLFNVFDKIFNNRVGLSNYYLKKENMSLIGNSVAEITNYVITMDNGYVFALVIYGVIVMTMLVIGYLLLIHRYHLQKKKIELAIIISIVIAGISEPFIFNTSFKNISYVFLGAELFVLFGLWTDRCRFKEYGFLSAQTEGFRTGDCTDEDIIPALEIRIKGLVFNFIEIWRTNKKKIIIPMLIIGCISGIIVWATYTEPQRVIVPRVQSDTSWMEGVPPITIEPEELDRYIENGDWVLKYSGADTPMQVFDGSITRVERVRATVSSALAGAFITCIICQVLLYRKK